VEPMLGAVELEQSSCGYLTGWETCVTMDRHGDPEPYQSQTEKLDWVICGGETGPGARPIQREWVADLRDQCVDANVPFFFKKWGPHSHKKETGIILDDAIRNTIDGVEWRQWPEELA